MSREPRTQTLDWLNAALDSAEARLYTVTAERDAARESAKTAEREQIAYRDKLSVAESEITRLRDQWARYLFDWGCHRDRLVTLVGVPEDVRTELARIAASRGQ